MQLLRNEEIKHQILNGIKKNKEVTIPECVQGICRFCVEMGRPYPTEGRIREAFAELVQAKAIKKSLNRPGVYIFSKGEIERPATMSNTKYISVKEASIRYKIPIHKIYAACNKGALKVEAHISSNDGTAPVKAFSIEGFENWMIRSGNSEKPEDFPPVYSTGPLKGESKVPSIKDTLQRFQERIKLLQEACRLQEEAARRREEADRMDRQAELLHKKALLA